MSAPDDYDDGYGPPTLEDDAWYTHAVASLGYPKPKRDPKPAEGQMSIQDVPEPGKVVFAERGPRAFLGQGIWSLHFDISWANGSKTSRTREVHVEEPGWYIRRSDGEWVRDENQEPEA